MEKPRLLVLTWDSLFWDIVELADAIKKSGYKPDLMVAIARGGWVVGRILSDILGLREVAGITISFYEDVDKRGKTPRITQPLSVDVGGKRILLVDDVADTGKTLEVAVAHVKGKGASDVKTAVPYVKPWCSFKPDYYVKVVDKWVVFPYEYCETLDSLVRQGYGRDSLKAHGFDEEVIRRFLDEAPG